MIMSSVEEVYRLSREFYEEIILPTPKNERDSLILKINEFLAKRASLLKKMESPYSAEETQLGKQIIDYNEKIQEKLTAIKQEIHQDILITKNKKKNAAKYINPYENLINDGIYYDKKSY